MAGYYIIPLLILLIQYTVCQEIEPVYPCLLDEVKADRSGVVIFYPSENQVTCTLNLTQLTPEIALYLEGSLTTFSSSAGRCPDSGGPVRVTFSTGLTLCRSTNNDTLTRYIITPATDSLSVTFNSSSSTPLDLAYYHCMSLLSLLLTPSVNSVTI